LHVGERAVTAVRDVPDRAAHRRGAVAAARAEPAAGACAQPPDLPAGPGRPARARPAADLEARPLEHQVRQALQLPLLRLLDLEQPAAELARLARAGAILRALE